MHQLFGLFVRVPRPAVASDEAVPDVPVQFRYEQHVEAPQRRSGTMRVCTNWCFDLRDYAFERRG